MPGLWSGWPPSSWASSPRPRSYTSWRAFLTPELGFGATLRVACYASATELVAWLPIVGPMTIFYWILLMVLGLISLNASATALTEEEKNA